MSETHTETQVAITIVEFRIGAKHTVNLGNFNNIQIEAELTVSVPEGADLTTLRAKAQETLRSFLEETYKAQRRTGNGGQTQRQPGQEG